MKFDVAIILNIVSLIEVQLHTVGIVNVQYATYPADIRWSYAVTLCSL